MARFQAFLDHVLRGAAVFGGFVLFAIMLLVSCAVIFRYVFNSPILGDQELVEIGMSLVVMLAMPYTALSRAHIRVDILDHLLGTYGRFIADAFTRIVSCFVLSLLVMKTYSKSLDAHEYGDVTNMLEVPTWIAYAGITIGMSLFILVLLVQLVQQFIQGVNDYE